MEYYFCLEFLYIFTWVLHVPKDCSFPYILQKKRMKIDQVRATVGVKIKSCRNAFSWTFNYIDCIGVKKV